MPEMAREVATRVVGDFLERFFRDEPHDTVAAINVLKHASGDLRYHWAVRGAFRTVFGDPGPSGELTRLVAQHAGRDVDDDEGAMQFLQKIYEECTFDSAVDFDELDNDPEA